MDELKRDAFNPERYEYMSIEDSRLYDSTTDPKVKELLLRLRDECRASHCRSTY